MIDRLSKLYDWFDHPDGPKFVETHRDDFRTSGHWLFLPGAFSSFHKVKNSDELRFIHQGKLLLYFFGSDRKLNTIRLGVDLDSGEVLVANVPADCWQAAELTENQAFAFGTNVCAPPFSFDEFSIAERTCLILNYPKEKDLILRLTRDTE